MTAPFAVAITKMRHAYDLPLPAYATALSSGVDLLAAVPANQTLRPGERLVIPSGIQIALPKGLEAQVRPRSGLAANHGITVLNSPGTIDADYRGEIGVILYNSGTELFAIKRGMKIAQLVFAPVIEIAWHEMEHLPPTNRGAGGFGSTGI